MGMECRQADFIDTLMAYENGELSHEQEVQLIQKLVDNGMAYQLQSRYARVAKDLITRGLVTHKGQQE